MAIAALLVWWMVGWFGGSQKGRQRQTGQTKTRQREHRRKDKGKYNREDNTGNAKGKTQTRQRQHRRKDESKAKATATAKQKDKKTASCGSKEGRITRFQVRSGVGEGWRSHRGDLERVKAGGLDPRGT